MHNPYAPKCVMLIGLPGSGKSTWIKNKNMAYRYEILSTDRFIDTCAAIHNKTYNEVFKDFIDEATHIFNADMKYYISIRTDIIIDQTNTSAKSRAKKLKSFLDAGYCCEAYVFESNMSLEQINELRPGKQIPAYVYQSMISNFQYPTLDEGFAYIYGVTHA